MQVVRYTIQLVMCYLQQKTSLLGNVSFLILLFLLTIPNNYFLNRLQDLQAKISALNTSKDTLERMCHNSRDEIQDIISKLENISLEVKDVQGEQRVQSKMLDARENQLVSNIYITTNLIPQINKNHPYIFVRRWFM